MAKDRQLLDISLLDDPTPAPPTGAASAGRALLDLSLLDDEPTPASGRAAALTSLGMTEGDFATWSQGMLAKMEQEKSAPYQPMPDPQDTGSKRLPGGGILPAADPTSDTYTTEDLLDVAGAPGAGFAKAINSTIKLAGDIGDSAAEFLGVDSPKVRPLPQVPYNEPQTIAGNVTSSVTQFTVGMLGFGKFLKAGQIMQGGGALMAAGRGALQGALTDATVFDPMEARLSNLVEDHPSLSNPITEYLAAKDDDSAAEGRFKNAVEGVILGGAVESLLLSLRGMKRIRAARGGGDEAVQKVAAEVADELEAAAQPKGVEDASLTPKPNTVPPEQSIKDYMLDRLARGSEFDPGYSADFNMAKQVTTNGARQAINLASEAAAGQIDTLKGGVQTFETIKALAAIAGEDPQNLLARMSATAANASKLAGDVRATEEIMLLLARQVSEEAKRIDNGLVTDTAHFFALQDSLGSIVADLKAVKTGAARTTSAGRMMKGEAAKLDPMALKALVAAGGDLDQVVKIVQGPSLGTKLVNVHNEFWINSLLSGPKTHIVNSTSNLLNTFARPAEKVLGGQVREGLHEFMGIAKSIKDSVGMAAKSWRLEESILDPSNLKTEGARFAISSGRFGMNPNSFMGSAVDWMGKAIRLPTRFLLSEDEFFKQLNYRANVYARATREGVEKGLSGKALANYMESRFASAFDGTGKGLDDVALQEARVSTFTEDLAPGIIDKMNKAAVAHPGLRLIIPFVRTPTNIIKQLGHRTPLVNLMMKSYREELAAGGARAATARGKWATGGLLWGSGLLLASEGKLTGRGPENPDERAVLMATGWRQYSVKAEDGTYYDYSRLDPFGMALGLAADFTEARGYMSDADAEDMALAMGAALARNLSSKTYLRGMTEALDALAQPDRNMKRWLQSRAGSYVPSGAKQIAGLIGEGDDTMREARSMLDAIKARTPGLSSSLPPKRNLLGEPIRYPAGLGPDSISPFAYSPELKDAVKAELARLSYGFKMPAEVVGNVRLTDFKNSKGQDAYDRLLELRGIERKGRYTLKERLAALIESESYKRLPDGNDEYSSKKLERVREILGEYHLATLKRLRKEFPEVDAAIRTDAQNAKAVQRKGVDVLKPLLGK